MRHYRYITFLIFATLWDAATTYARTPDLSRETNPIVRACGSSWTSVCIIDVLSLILCGLAFAYFTSAQDLAQFPKKIPKDKFLDFEFFEGARPWWHIFLRIPSRRGVSLLQLASLVAFALPLYRLLIGGSNISLVLSKEYEKAFARWSTPLVAVYMAIAMVASIYIHFILRYRKYMNA